MLGFCGRKCVNILNFFPRSRNVASISFNHARLASLGCQRIPSRNCSAAAQVESCDAPDDLYKRLEIEVKGHDPKVLNSYERFVTMTAHELDIPVSKVTTPPKIIEKYTLLKSVHIYKKKRVQYETRTHFKVIELKHLTGSTADSLLEYIQRNLPEGVAMKVTRHRIEQIPEHLQPPKQLVDKVDAEVS